jgi:hypothetical protein
MSGGGTGGGTPVTLSPTDQALINQMTQQQNEMFAMSMAVATAEEKFQAESSVPQTIKGDAHDITT